MKGRRKSTSNIDRRSSLRLRPQEDGTHEVSTFLPDPRDSRVSKARDWSTKKRPLTEKGTESSVKKTKKIKGDSSSEVSCSGADVSNSRIHSSVATLPVRELPQMKKPLSNVSKTLNNSVKRSQRHKEPTPKNEVLNAKSAKQSSIKKSIEIVNLSSDSSPEKSPEQFPVTTLATNEEAMRKSHGDALDINESSPFLPDRRDKRVSKREWSNASFSGSVKDIKRVVTRKIPRPSSNLVIKTAETRNEEPLQIKPSVTKQRHADSSVKKSRTHAYQTRSNVQVEYDSSRTVKGKNNGRSRSPSKRPISRTHDKQSKDISEPANGLRRSSRFRVPPLDIWRNERLVFETLPSGDVTCSVDKGSEEDKYGLIQITKKAERRAQMKKKKALTVENTPTPILDTRTGETVNALLHRPFESLQWLMMGPNEVERPSPYTMVQAFESNSTSFGFLKFSPFGIKEMQYAPLHNLHFVLMKGHLEVVIQNTTFSFTAGDSWMVPLGVPYSIKNCSRARALLSFTVFKSPFYQHQFAE
ncbi:CENP-C_C domain-containing protein [Trichonephila clavipes]|nr:CENP-C_C domain-containing protein [Trichonephila clavipes]